MGSRLYVPVSREELPDLMRKILEEDLIPLAMAKGHDYAGPETDDTLANVGESLGWAGAFLRLRDKVRRLSTALVTALAVRDESVEDAMRDLLNYAFYQLILYRRRCCDVRVQLTPVDMPKGGGADA